MAINLKELNVLFNAGCPVVSIPSPKVSERELIWQILNFSASRSMKVQEWSSDSFQKWESLNQPQSQNRFTQPEPVSTDSHLTSLQIAGNKVIRQKGLAYPSLSGRGLFLAQTSFLHFLRKYCQTYRQSESQPERILFVVRHMFAEFDKKSADGYLDFVNAVGEACLEVKESPMGLIFIREPEQKNIFEDLIVDLPNPLPDEVETKQILESRIEALKRAARRDSVELRIDESDRTKQGIVRALLGFPKEGMIDILQRVVTTDLAIDGDTAKKIATIKKERYREMGIEYAQPPDVAPQGMPRLMAQLNLDYQSLSPDADESLWPRGYLFVGPPGVGKSLAAKNAAAMWQLEMLVLDMSAIVQGILGESEKKFRQIIQIAEDLSPCILLMDEIDKAFARTQDDTMQRIKGYFLRWTQERKKKVPIFATANDPTVLSPEILRRFDMLWYVDLPGIEVRHEIFKVQLQKLNLLERELGIRGERQLQRIAERAANFTGDEIRKVCVQTKKLLLQSDQSGNTALLEVLSQQTERVKPRYSENNEDLRMLRSWAASGGVETVCELSNNSNYLAMES